MTASITITINEFDDILYEKIDKLAYSHGEQIFNELKSFLFSIGTVQIVYSTGKNSTWRF